jgi:hypothetical protein
MKTAQIERVAFSSTVQQTPAARRVAGARRSLRVTAVADVQQRLDAISRPKVSFRSCLGIISYIPNRNDELDCLKILLNNSIVSHSQIPRCYLPELTF